jgi:hypothetical protein
MSNETTPAETTRLAEAEFRRRAQNHHLRAVERDQFTALADLFGEIGGDMAFRNACEVPGVIPTPSGDMVGPVVVDDEGRRPDWTAALAAARAYLDKGEK